MTEFLIDEIGLPKMDTDAAERQVLAESLSPWLDRTRVLAVELHERHVPRCTATLEQALTGRPCRRSQHGEYTIATFHYDSMS
jgi:hypothetical protein